MAKTCLNQMCIATIAIAAAAFFSLGGALGLAAVASFASVMAKLALDAIIQRDVDESVRSSVFGRSETFVQLAWVLGGAVGLIPFSGRVGFIFVAVAMVVAVLAAVFGIRPPARRRPASSYPPAKRSGDSDDSGSYAGEHGEPRVQPGR